MTLLHCHGKVSENFDKDQTESLESLTGCSLGISVLTETVSGSYFCHIGSQLNYIVGL